jgi:hypothetical protein
MRNQQQSVRYPSVTQQEFHASLPTFRIQQTQPLAKPLASSLLSYFHFQSYMLLSFFPFSPVFHLPQHSCWQFTETPLTLACSNTIAKPLTQPASCHGKGQVSASLENNNIKQLKEELENNSIKQLEQELEYRNQDFNDALTSWIVTTDSFFVEDFLDDHLQYISYSYADTIAFFLYHNTSGTSSHPICDKEWLYDDIINFPTKLYYLEQLNQQTPTNSSPPVSAQLPITSNSYDHTVEMITDEDLIHFLESKSPASTLR